jgi:hypothetical protein
MFKKKKKKKKGGGNILKKKRATWGPVHKYLWSYTQIIGQWPMPNGNPEVTRSYYLAT